MKAKTMKHCFQNQLQVLLDFPSTLSNPDSAHRCHWRACSTSWHKLVCKFLVCILSLARLKLPQGQKLLQKYFCKARVLQCYVAAWMAGKFEGVMDICVGWEDPLEKEMTTDSRFLAWEIPKTEEPGGLQFMGLQRVGHDLATQTTTNQDTCICMAESLYCPPETIATSLIDYTPI